MKIFQNQEKSGTFTGWHMLIVMLLFFGVIVSVNITMAILAGRTWTGLVVTNSYVASQNFNAELREARLQQQRGWTSDLQYEGGAIQFSLRDRQGQPVVIDGLKLNYGRPAFEQADQTVGLEYVGDGLYRAAATLKAGIWALKVSGGTGDSRYRRDSRLYVGEDGASGQEE
ncbi:MAG: FixH family protein [Pseudomonadota bacterium]